MELGVGWGKGWGADRCLAGLGEGGGRRGKGGLGPNRPFCFSPWIFFFLIKNESYL